MTQDRISTSTPNSLRILSYNIHKGFALGNQRYVLDQIREGIRAAKPDVVCLQEVSGLNSSHLKNVKNYTLRAQFEHLADEVWPHFAYGKNSVYKNGHHGNAILSRYPISHWHNLDISTNRYESRGMLHATLAIPGASDIHILSTHLNLFESSRGLQLASICRYLEAKIPKRDKMVLAGDFNDWRKKVSPIFFSKLSLKEAFFEKHGAYAKSFPSLLPLLSLDRIYFRQMHVGDAIGLVGQPWNQLSDHIPITAKFLF
jgi:endonuclease/exonuclease/phosphatase family metal-dependent hydrolase